MYLPNSFIMSLNNEAMYDGIITFEKNVYPSIFFL